MYKIIISFIAYILFRIVILGLIGLVILFLLLDQPIVPYRFASFGGLLAYLFIGWFFSKHRAQVSYISRSLYYIQFGLSETLPVFSLS